MPGGQGALDDRLATSAGEPSVVKSGRIGTEVNFANIGQLETPWQRGLHD